MRLFKTFKKNCTHGSLCTIIGQVFDTVASNPPKRSYAHYLGPKFGSDIRKKNKRLSPGNLSPQFVSSVPFPDSGHGPQRHSITLIVAPLLRAILKLPRNLPCFQQAISAVNCHSVDFSSSGRPCWKHSLINALLRSPVSKRDKFFLSEKTRQKCCVYEICRNVGNYRNYL